MLRIQAPTCCHARCFNVFVEDGVRVTPFACSREEINATELAISKDPAFISEMQNDRVGSRFGLKSILEKKLSLFILFCYIKDILLASSSLKIKTVNTIKQ